MERVKLILGEFVEKVEQCEGEVVVTFGKSKEVRTYDLLVAADGLGSKIRGMMLKSRPQEQIHDEGVHAAYFTIKRDMLQGGRLAKWYNTTGGRVIFLRPDPNPAGYTRGMFMNVTWNGDIGVKDRLNEAIREGKESYMKLMEEMFHDAGWVAPQVLQSMRESDNFYCSLFAQVRTPKIQDGRVVLLGDAGYATPGFGTSLAIIGGYILAGELLDHPGNVEVALKRYEELMLPFVKGSQGDDCAMQLLNPQTQWGIVIRNTILSFVTWTKLDKMAMVVAAWLGFTEKKFPLPNYQWPA